mgnify:CR=1 FL=1
MNKAIRWASIILMICSPSIQAGTIVEIQNQDEMTRIMTDGKLARIDMSAAEYALVDYKNHSVRLVDHQKQQVMLLNADAAATGSGAPKLRTSINDLGPGQPIAGYKTHKFGYTANGRSCGVVYGSKDAYRARGIKELVSAMDTMMAKQRAALGGLAGMIDDCTLADMKLSDYISTIGVPMRTERNGRVDTQIKSIKTDVVLPANTFVIPASYKKVSLLQEKKAASVSMADTQQNKQVNPYQNQQTQMRQMMRQMQQSGQLTPEMIEQMRRAQEMMRYQQHR